MGKILGLGLLLLALRPAFAGEAAEGGRTDRRVVASHDFEGDLKANPAGDRFPPGFFNNYTWGKKDLSIATDRGIDGQGLRFDIRGISSGEMQFFSPPFPIWRTKFYRVSFAARGENFAGGKINVVVRKRESPYTPYLRELWFEPGPEWQRYSFVAEAQHDVDSDMGVLFRTGSTGRFWLDELTVEEFDYKPDEAVRNRNPVVKGNLLPRSSYEGVSDPFWTNGIYAHKPYMWYGDWRDPRLERTEGGRYGRYAMAIPLPAETGVVFAKSLPIPVAANEPYVFSADLRADGPAGELHVALERFPGKQVFAQQRFPLGEAWQRVELRLDGVPDDCETVLITLTAGAGDADARVLVDGLQFEHGEAAAPYRPAFPREITLAVADGPPNTVAWGEPFVVTAHAGDALGEDGGELPARLKLVAYPDRVVEERGVRLRADGAVRLEFAPVRNGIFRLEVIPEDPARAAPAELVLARLPAPRVLGAESMFGAHITVRPFFLAYAKAIGLQWNRLHDCSFITKWSQVEPIQGQRRWADEPVDAMRAAGFSLLGLPDYPPAWAVRADKAQQLVDPEAFREHCRALAEHFKGRIDHWEVWNEPYVQLFFPRPWDRFPELFEAGYQGFKEGNPAARVLGFCTEANSLNFIAAMPERLRTRPDIVSFHGYFQNLTGGGSAGFEQEIAALAKAMGGERAYWNTEGAFGEVGGNSFHSYLGSPSVNERALAFASRVWQEQRKAGVEKLFLYTLHQSDTIIYQDGLKKLIDYDRSPTPAAVATAVTAYAMDGLAPVPTPKTAGIVESLFSDGRRHSWSVYNDSSVPGGRAVDLTKLPESAEVFDPLGNDPRRDGLTRWPLGILPLFAVAESGTAAAWREQCARALILKGD